MGDLTEHFSRYEFDCNCGCGFNAADIKLVEVLEDVRTHFDKAITITGPNRCCNQNKKIGGAPRSQHVHGKAVDFIVVGINEKEVADYLEEKYPDTFGIGRYPGRTHVDVRKEKARWGSNNT